jgi:hypothetical protein
MINIKFLFYMTIYIIRYINLHNPYIKTGLINAMQTFKELF